MCTLNSREATVSMLDGLRVFLFCAACLAYVPAQASFPQTESPLVPSKIDSGELDARETVFPIAGLKIRFGLELAGGTGFCLDPACRFIGTNHHVAERAHFRTIMGQKVVRRYDATGSRDEGAARDAALPGTAIKYASSRDLAVFELRRPLARHHGLTFSLADMVIGQEIEIFACPGRLPSRIPVRFSGTYSGTTVEGLLAFKYRPTADATIHPGASGGIVVDRKSQRVVGVLSGIDSNDKLTAVAVPAQSLADFLRVQIPFLGARLFPPSTAELQVLADIYPRFVPAPQSGIQFRSPEPAEVMLLRQRSQALADSMRNFIAVQTFEWGSGNHEPSAEAAYEIRVVDGYQRFRLYPDGTKLLQDVPFPNLDNSLVPGGDWSELPAMVGTVLGLNIHQAPSTIINGRTVQVFQYWASIEDRVCQWRSVKDFIFFSLGKDSSYACHGEVWTDEETNVLRISQHYEMSGAWSDVSSVVSYGWLRREGESPRLIPVSISTQVLHNKRIYWCRGLFTNYRVFDVRSRLTVGLQPGKMNADRKR